MTTPATIARRIQDHRAKTERHHEQARSAAGRVAERMEGMRAHIARLQKQHRDDVAAAVKATERTLRLTEENRAQAEQIVRLKAQLAAALNLSRQPKEPV